MQVRIFGFDPGLNHGAMVFCVFEMDFEQIVLADFAQTFHYNKKSDISLNMKSSSEDIFEFSQSLVKSMGNSLGDGYNNGYHWLGTRVLSDFDASSVHWRTQKKQVVKLAQLMGYLQRTFHERGLSTASITPSEIRQWLGLANSASKEEVHAEFTTWLSINGDEKSWDVLQAILEIEQDKKDRDLLDAYILAQFGAQVAFSQFVGKLSGSQGRVN